MIYVGALACYSIVKIFKLLIESFFMKNKLLLLSLIYTTAIPLLGMEDSSKEKVKDAMYFINSIEEALTTYQAKNKDDRYAVGHAKTVADHKARMLSKQDQTIEKQNTMTFIKSWKEVEPFAGTIMAYIATTPRFGYHKGYPVDKNQLIKYAYVRKAPTNNGKEEGYGIVQLLLPKEVFSGCVIDNTMIAKNCLGGALQVRKITEDESSQIYTAITTKKAVFSYDTEEDALAYLLKLQKRYQDSRDLMDNKKDDK